jgi:hypothetical protein
MNVIDGLRRIQKHWPDATFKMSGERLDVMHRRLQAVSEGPEPKDLAELIRRMDQAGLGVQGNLVVFMD